MRFAGNIILLLLLCSSLYSQVSGEETEFAKKVLEAFKQKDYGSYKKLCVTHQDYIDEILPDLKAEAKRMGHRFSFQDVDAIYTPSHLDSLNLGVFRMIKGQGTKAGIKDWNKMEFDRFELLDGAQQKKEKTIYGNIWFTYNHETFGLYALMIEKFASGYHVFFIRGIGKQK